jgi:hypothetical protein
MAGLLRRNPKQAQTITNDASIRCVKALRNEKGIQQRKKKSLARSPSSINCETKLKEHIIKREYTPGKLLRGSWRFSLLLSRQFPSRSLQFSSIRLSYTTGSLRFALAGRKK